jgi:hypothetical protein
MRMRDRVKPDARRRAGLRRACQKSYFIGSVVDQSTDFASFS